MTLLAGSNHGFEDGETVLISQVEGMDLLKDVTKSINGSTHKV